MTNSQSSDPNAPMGQGQASHNGVNGHDRDPSQNEGRMDKMKAQAGEKARAMGQQGLEKASDFIGGIASAAHDLGNRQQGSKVGDYAHKAGERLDQYASRLRDADLDNITTDVRAFVRRNPALAIGGAVVVGFLLARMFRAGSSASDINEDFEA